MQICSDWLLPTDLWNHQRASQQKETSRIQSFSSRLPHRKRYHRLSAATTQSITSSSDGLNCCRLNGLWVCSRLWHHNHDEFKICRGQRVNGMFWNGVCNKQISSTIVLHPLLIHSTSIAIFLYVFFSFINFL